MRASHVSVLCTILWLGVFCATPSFAQDGAKLYRDYCAGCHGSRLEGNRASPLIKDDWEYGKTRDLLVRNITYGIQETEMGAWKDVLREESIAALADYIIQAQETSFDAVRPLPAQIETNDYVLDVTVVAETEIKSPWAIAFASADLAFITEREGAIRVLENGKLRPDPVANTPFPFQTPFGGFLGITLDPEFEESGWVYLALCESSVDQKDSSAPAMLKVVRGRIEENAWVDQEILFQADDALHVAGGNRWGGPLRFDQEGYLHFSIGDLGVGDASQDPHRVPGKTFRIHADGSIPTDNPYANEPGAIGAIFTLGNRNTQGLAIHPETGELWSTDHGPMGGDEVNILKNGANYGWPIVTYGINYDGEVVSDKTHAEGMVQPVLQWSPSIAVSSATFVTGQQFPAWEYDLIVGALAFEEVRRLTVDNNSITDEETLLRGYGRVRDVQMSPDGSLYIVLNKPDKIVKLTAAQ